MAERAKIVITPRASTEPEIVVHDADPVRHRRREWAALLAAIPLLALLGWALGGVAWWLSAWLKVIAAALLVHVALPRPLLLFAHRVRRERARMLQALTCPWCRDVFADESALVCDREGCGAFYHPACWEDCAASYGGCGIYGCGCASAHDVGADALRRHVRRMVIAAALFPPRALRRLRAAQATAEVKHAIDEAVEQRDAIARSPSKSFRVGIFAMACSFSIAMVVIGTADPYWVMSDDFAYTLPIFFFVPSLFFAVPFFVYLVQNLIKALARWLRGELAALERVDAGKGLKKGPTGKDPAPRSRPPAVAGTDPASP